MDPEGFPTSIFRWDLTKGVMTPQLPPPLPPAYAYRLGGLEELFAAYGIRGYTAARIAELGFTGSTLVNMRDEELDEMMDSVSHIFRWELLVGERYGIKAAVRAERRRLQDVLNGGDSGTLVLDSLSQEGLSEEPVQQEKEAGSGGIATWQVSSTGVSAVRKKNQLQQRGRNKKKAASNSDPILDGGDDVDGEDGETGEGILERQREHPFIVTEPGEVARGKKNGLDYLFHLYDQCREFLVQVQNIAKERGEKCPTKVTNQVFRYAKKAGATYINKPKMRHYVHCYALHCLDVEASNELRKAYKERGENVGAWRQACYKPLVAIAAGPQYSWDIDALFNSHPRLSVWYVPTRLRQLCHAHRNAAAGGGGGSPLMMVSPTVSSADHQILPPY